MRNVNDDAPLAVGDGWFYVGVDDRGVELETILIPDDRREGDWAIVHAMPTEFRE